MWLTESQELMERFRIYRCLRTSPNVSSNDRAQLTELSNLRCPSTFWGNGWAVFTRFYKRWLHLWRRSLNPHHSTARRYSSSPSKDTEEYDVLSMVQGLLSEPSIGHIFMQLSQLRKASRIGVGGKTSGHRMCTACSFDICFTQICHEWEGYAHTWMEATAR